MKGSKSESNNDAEMNDKVYKVIKEVLGVKEVSGSESLVWDLLADSLQLVELYTALEHEFKIQINADEVQGEMTVLDVCALVKHKQW